MTTPTGLGLRNGPETADPAGAPDGTRLSRSMRNDATAVHGETAEGFYKGEVDCTDPIWT